MIVVVGAGPCGLFVATRLHELGHDVLVLSSSQKILSFKNPKLKHWIESPGIGGRAKLWGGWLDFPDEQDLKKENWPISYEIVKKEEAKVRKWLQAKKQHTSKNLIKLGYQNKFQAMRTWKKWPFKIRNKIKVQNLIEEENKIIGLQCWDEKKQEIFEIEAEEVILCCSPFSTLSLLKKLKKRTKSIESKLNNHMVAGFIALYPKTNLSPKIKTSYAFKKIKKGIIELQGPLPANQLDSSWQNYEYYKFHYIAEFKPKNFVVKDFIVEGKIQITNKEKLLAKKMEKKLIEEIKLLGLKNLVKYKIQKTLDITNIAHESGGAILGKVVNLNGRVKNYSNLSIMDSSVMPTGLKTYPTLTLLCLISSFLEKRKEG